MIFHPDAYRYAEVKSHRSEVFGFESFDGTQLEGIWVHARTDPHGVVLIAHGNAQNYSAFIGEWIWLAEAGWDVVMFDYRGFGNSQGTPDLQGSIEDTRAAIAWVASREERPFILIGQSLGGAMVLNALTCKEARHVRLAVIEGTYAALGEAGRETLARNLLTWPLQWIAPWVLEERFDPLDMLDRISTPLLFVAGAHDTTISPNHSWQLFERALKPKAFWLVKDAGHINAFASRKMRSALLEFLQEPDFDPRFSSMKIYDKIAPSSTKGTQ